MRLGAHLFTRGGLEVLARFNQLFFPAAGLLAVVFLLSAKDMRLERVLPLFDAGLVPVLKGAAAPASWLGEIAVFASVTLPLAWRGILAGTVLAYARAMGEFGATLMVAGNIPNRTQTLSIAIYDAVQAGNLDLANLLVLAMTAATVLALLALGKVAGAVRW
ncbi:MAG: hypothetical protein K6T75_06125 [Acetobacteraceae bacterium]|nr:hypothetical protein [Acetobacteraceae bacterium]